MARLSAPCCRYMGRQFASFPFVVLVYHKIHLNGAQSSGNDNKHSGSRIQAQRNWAKIPIIRLNNGKIRSDDLDALIQCEIDDNNFSIHVHAVASEKIYIYIIYVRMYVYWVYLLVHDLTFCPTLITFIFNQFLKCLRCCCCYRFSLFPFVVAVVVLLFFFFLLLFLWPLSFIVFCFYFNAFSRLLRKLSFCSHTQRTNSYL